MVETTKRKLGTRERRILQSESRWLQKALFALSKAESDREKLAKERGEAVEPITVELDGKSYELDDVRDAVGEAVQERVETIRTTLHRSRSLLR
jgi:hypothetical protein